MLRYARYAAAVVFALLAAGFVTLWVRSHYREDGLCWGVTDKSAFIAFSANGTLLVNYVSNISSSNGSEVKFSKWFVASYSPGEAFWYPREGVNTATFGFGFCSYPSGSFITVAPHWFLAASSLGLAALFAFKRTWRYSLRSILVATTLLAAVLGLAVYVV